MAQTALGAGRAVTLTPLHLIRAGAGRDAIRVQAQGFGWLLSSVGFFFVRGGLDTVRLRRLDTCRALYLGTRGLCWAKVELPVAGLISTPSTGDASPPPLPSLVPLPSLQLQLVVHPPECPE